MHYAALTAFIPLLLLVGCSSSGQDRAATAAKTVSSAIARTHDLAGPIDAVVTALAPFQSGEGDRKQSYQVLQTAATNLQAAVTAATREVTAARAASERYAADWEKRLGTVADAEIVATSRSRLDQLRAGIERVALADSDFQTGLTGFSAQLKDLKTALDLDLSAGGVAALRNSIAATIANAPAVKQRATTLADRLSGLSGFLGD